MPYQTDELEVVLVDPQQSGTRETVNEGISGLAKAAAAEYVADLSASGATHTLPYESAEGGDKSGLHVYRYLFTGTPAQPVDIVHPAVKHQFAFVNETNQTLTIKVVGQTGIAISPGDARLVYCDDTNMSALSVGGGGLTAGEGIAIAGNVVSVDIDGENAESSPDPDADYVLIWDASANELKKVLLNNLPTGGGVTPAPSSTDSASRSLALTDANTFRIVDSASAVVFTVEQDSVVNLPLDCEIGIHQLGLGRVSLQFDPVITLSMPDDRNPACRASGTTIWMKKTGPNFFIVSGDLETA